MVYVIETINTCHTVTKAEAKYGCFAYQNTYEQFYIITFRYAGNFLSLNI